MTTLYFALVLYILKENNDSYIDTCFQIYLNSDAKNNIIYIITIFKIFVINNFFFYLIYKSPINLLKNISILFSINI